jgi:beta-glucosidase
MVMVPDQYQAFIANLIALVKENQVPQTRIDDAVRRILLLKFKMGLFEKPMADKTLLAKVGSAEHRAVAAQAVKESLVLLKNTGVLPLKPELKKIAVIGGKADDIGVQCGGWTMTWQGQQGKITTGTTILQGIKTNAPAGTEIVFSADGKNIEGADLVIAVVGENPYAEMNGDDKDIELEKTDLNLVKAAGTIPLVTILLSGRTMIINSALADSEAFVAAWLPGSEGGAIAEVLFGKADFKGRLSFTWPASVDQLPINETVKNKSLFPFGYGLSYK